MSVTVEGYSCFHNIELIFKKNHFYLRNDILVYDLMTPKNTGN